MMGFGVFPAFDLTDPKDPRVQACLTLVTEIVCESLRQQGDCFHHAIDWRDPGAEPWAGLSSELREPHVVDLGDPTLLREVVHLSVDCFDGRGSGVIRSIGSCRAVTFGYDGQAFLLLGQADTPPASPDQSLVIVEEMPDLISRYDYFD
ncbi:hypothetical protein [Sphingomonas sp. KR3-1]|uniref:hypothetical protein n=1 Tax=Sphingomonas sp. KR3-1 TaxID=3156611 RepID=UPI0032B59E72